MCSSIEDYDYEDKLELFTIQMKGMVLEIMLDTLQDIRRNYAQTVTGNQLHDPDEPAF
jgi:hypothetical protein